jgi:Zn-dependent protease
VTAKVDQLCQVVDAASPTGAPVTTPPAGKGGRRAGGIAGLASLAVAFLAKFKFLILFLLTKGKLLLLGLTKASTLLTMLLSFGVYWSVWGWKFAAGFIVSIYVHEMGHVAMLHRFGIRATAPMFIPGFGAVVRLREALPTAREDARVGLAGPIWGTAAAVIAWGISLATGSALFAAIAKTGAWINLFNLTPVWQLDGSRAFRALTQPQRWIAVSVVAVAFAISQQQILLVLLALGVFRAFERPAATEPDLQALVEYGWLVAVLSALATVPTPVR